MKYKKTSYSSNVILFLDNQKKIEEVCCSAIFNNLTTIYIKKSKFTILDYKLTDYDCVALDSRSKVICTQIITEAVNTNTGIILLNPVDIKENNLGNPILLNFINYNFCLLAIHSVRHKYIFLANNTLCNINFGNFYKGNLPKYLLELNPIINLHLLRIIAFKDIYSLKQLVILLSEKKDIVQLIKCILNICGICNSNTTFLSLLCDLFYEHINANNNNKVLKVIFHTLQIFENTCDGQQFMIKGENYEISYSTVYMILSTKYSDLELFKDQFIRHFNSYTKINNSNSGFVYWVLGLSLIYNNQKYYQHFKDLETKPKSKLEVINKDVFDICSKLIKTYSPLSDLDKDEFVLSYFSYTNYRFTNKLPDIKTRTFKLFLEKI